MKGPTLCRRPPWIALSEFDIHFHQAQVHGAGVEDGLGYIVGLGFRVRYNSCMKTYPKSRLLQVHALSLPCSMSLLVCVCVWVRA